MQTPRHEEAGDRRHTAGEAMQNMAVGTTGV